MQTSGPEMEIDAPDMQTGAPEMQTSDHEMETDDEGEEETTSEHLPSSADPSQPLTGGPAMNAALEEIVTDSRGRRTRDHDPAQKLRELIAAQRQVEAANKAEAEKATATGQDPAHRPEKRSRTTSNGSQTDSGKRTKTDQSAPDTDSMELTEEKLRKNRPTSFRHLKKPPKLLCAIQINDNEIMGDPFASPNDWNLKLVLDPGTLGVPSIGLDFQVGRGVDSSNQTWYRDSFNVEWQPGVKIGGRWMIEELAMMQATAPAEERLQNLAYPPAIRELLVKSGKKSGLLTQNLIFAMFQSNVHRVSEINWASFNTLDDDARRAPLANLDTMLSGTEPSYKVKMWFVNRNCDLETFVGNCLGPLIDAVTDHTPPLHQNPDDDDQAFINHNLPGINAIGNGGKVQNRSVPPKHLSQPKPLRWDSSTMLYASASIRDEEKVSIPSAQRGPRSPREPPRKAPKSPADLEMLRLKDRQTLHRLDPS